MQQSKFFSCLAVECHQSHRIFAAPTDDLMLVSSVGSYRLF